MALPCALAYINRTVDPILQGQWDESTLPSLHHHLLAPATKPWLAAAPCTHQVAPRYCPWGCNSRYKRNFGDAPGRVHEEYKEAYAFGRALLLGAEAEAVANKTLKAGKCVA
jgi:hypothetical protein